MPFFFRYYYVKNRETFNEIILRYRGLLYSVCRRYSSDDMDVDDLLQETSLELWKRREKLMGITSPPLQAAWIWRVARSTCIDICRCTRKTEPMPEGFDIHDEETSLHDELYELIAQLPEPDRSIATLHLEGYDYKEIAEHTGLTKSNVGVRLMRIKDKLKQLWNETE